MIKQEIESRLSSILERYQKNFSEKIYVDVYDSTDVLMDAFGITQDIKRENKQFWGRQLGMCWQLLVVELFRSTCPDFGGALKFGNDEPCDLVAGKDAIDTKYRVGSGDPGTLKKFRQYGKLLKDKGYNPVLLFVRGDNLPAAIRACEVGGWSIHTGKNTFDYIQTKTDFDMYSWLIYHKDNGTFLIDRKQ